MNYRTVLLLGILCAASIAGCAPPADDTPQGGSEGGSNITFVEPAELPSCGEVAVVS